MELKVRLLNGADRDFLPAYMSDHAVGADLRAHIEEDLVISAGKTSIVPTGISIELPEGYEAQIRPRSGLAFKHGITVLNTPGTIDPDYRGEIKVILINHSGEDFRVSRGMRIAQMVINRVEIPAVCVTEELSNTTRGEGGFGHTGV